METEIFGEGLQHEFFVVVSALYAILKHLILLLEWLLEVFLVDVAGWFVVEDVDPLEELDVVFYEVVGACV